MTNYQTARESGLLPPLAAAVAVWKSLPTYADNARKVHPAVMLTIFAAAYVAGLVGSLAALLVALAFIGGLSIAAQSPQPIYLRHKAPAPPTAPNAPQPAVPGQPAPSVLTDAHAAGLVIREIKLSQPPANGRAKKTEDQK